MLCLHYCIFIIFQREIGECFDEISLDKSCRAVVLSGEGKGFSAGIDFMDFMDVLQSADSDDIARKTNTMYRQVRGMQDRFTALERVSWNNYCLYLYFYAFKVFLVLQASDLRGARSVHRRWHQPHHLCRHQAVLKGRILQCEGSSLR